MDTPARGPGEVLETSHGVRAAQTAPGQGQKGPSEPEIEPAAPNLTALSALLADG